MSAELELATEIGWLQRAVVATLRIRPASVLDVGCGSKRPFGVLAESVVGIDSDANALKENRSLTKAVHADLTKAPLGTEVFDVIVCWNVLEHVPEPTILVARLTQALKPGGVLVLAFSNVGSVRGLVTRLTPTFVHRAVLRHVLGGKHGAPYPTQLRGDHHPFRILENAKHEGLVPVHVRFYEGYHERRLRELHPVVYEAWSAAVRLFVWLAPNRLDSRSDVLMALEKRV